MIRIRQVVAGWRWDNVILAVAAAAFAVIYAFLPLAAPWRFNSPDESSNAFFIRKFATEAKLWHFEGMDVILPNLVHPRSVRIMDGFLVPGGFLGLPVLYGALTALLGQGALPFLTPALAALSAVLFGLLMRRLFDRQVGTWAALLLMIQPAWWYESSRVLYPNVPFVVFVIASAWFFFAAPIAKIFKEKPKSFAWFGLSEKSTAAWSGALFGLALAIRPSEAYWLLPLVLVLAVWGWHKLPWARLAFFSGAALLMLLPFVFLNQVVYGSWFGTGYGAAVGESVVAARSAGWGERLLGPVAPWLFPLGFAPRTAWENFSRYALGFFDWWAAGVAVTSAWALWRQRRRRLDAKIGIFLAAAAIVVVWLGLFYGSYVFSDNPDPRAVTIGSSYLRYWLPVFVLSVVPLAWGLARLAELKPPITRSIVVGLYLTLLLLSGWSVFAAPQEGLLTLRQNLLRYDSETRRVVELTEPNALIVVERADKLLFPERRVLLNLRSETTYAALAKVAGMPLYYFGITLPPQDIAWLNATKLPPLRLRIEPVERFAEETLYALRFNP